MYLLQKLFTIILNPIKIPEKVRNISIQICFGAIFIMEILHYSEAEIIKQASYTDLCVIGCIFLGLIIILSKNTELKILKTNKLFSTLWILCGLIIFIISFIHPVGDGFRALSLIIIFAFPCLWFVWFNRNDQTTLYTLIAKSFSVVGCLYFVYCLIFFPLDTPTLHIGRYYGTTINPNALGFFCTSVFVCALYSASTEFKRKLICIMYFLIAVLANIITIFTVSRTSLLCNICAACVFSVFFFKTHIKGSKNKTKNGIIFMIILHMLISSLFIALIAVNSFTGTSLINRKPAEPEFNSSYLVASSSQTESDVKANEVNMDRLQNNSLDLNTLSSGRIAIWQVYISNLNLLGNNGNELVTVNSVNFRNPHNTVLDIAHRTGIVNGIIFMIIEILSVAVAVYYIFSKKHKDTHHMFIAMCILNFAIYSLLEIATFPFRSPSVFLYYIVLGTLFFSNISEQESE